MVGPGAKVADAEGAADDGVQRRPVAGAVVGHHALGGDAMPLIEADRAAQERGDDPGGLVSKHLDVGQARGSGGSSRDSLPSPMLFSTAETVESAIPVQRAISAPVIRNRRNAAISWTRSCGVRCGIRPGAEDRSTSPTHHHLAAFRPEQRVSVQLHPVSSLELSRLAALSLQGGPDQQPP
jgi:hypothetical protein